MKRTSGIPSSSMPTVFARSSELPDTDPVANVVAFRSSGIQ